MNYFSQSDFPCLIYRTDVWFDQVWAQGSVKNLISFPNSEPGQVDKTFLNLQWQNLCDALCQAEIQIVSLSFADFQRMHHAWPEFHRALIGLALHLHGQRENWQRYTQQLHCWTDLQQAKVQRVVFENFCADAQDQVAMQVIEHGIACASVMTASQAHSIRDSEEGAIPLRRIIPVINEVDAMTSASATQAIAGANLRLDGQVACAVNLGCQEFILPPSFNLLAWQASISGAAQAWRGALIEARADMNTTQRTNGALVSDERSM